MHSGKFRISARVIISSTVILFIFCASVFFFFDYNSSAKQWTLKESGIASYYGKGFFFKRTASSEIYCPWDMTAASLSLPLGTEVKVVNRLNRKSVFVRINDRGPYIKNRILDLSYAAAYKLDMLQTGIAPVEIYIIAAE